MNIPLINSSEPEIMDFIKQIKSSNMAKQVQDDLIRILNSVLEQMQQFKIYGWL
jgi:hypothetical protein